MLVKWYGGSPAANFRFGLKWPYVNGMLLWSFLFNTVYCGKWQPPDAKHGWRFLIKIRWWENEFIKCLKAKWHFILGDFHLSFQVTYETRTLSWHPKSQGIRISFPELVCIVVPLCLRMFIFYCLGDVQLLNGICSDSRHHMHPVGMQSRVCTPNPKVPSSIA